MGALSIILFSAAMTVAMLSYDVGSLAVRVTMGVVTVSGFKFMIRDGFLHRTEVQWAGWLGLYFLASCMSFIFAVNPQDAMVDIWRQAVLVVFAFALAVLLRRSKQSELVLMYTMPLLTIGFILLILFISVKEMGLPSLDLQAIRTFKFALLVDYGISVNPLSWAAVLAFLIAIPVLVKYRKITLAIAVILCITLFISGSRTTLGGLLLIGLLFQYVRQHRKSQSAKVIVPLLVVGILALAGYYLRDYWQPLLDPSEFNNVLTGRPDLWLAALQKFIARPIFGWGAYSWSVDLDKYLTLGDFYQQQSLLSIDTGAFHNAFLTLLAEKGLTGFAAGLGLIWFLLRQSLYLYKNSSFLSQVEARMALLAPFILCAIAVRSIFEQPGLFGYANGIVDYLTYSWAALVVALSATLRRACPWPS